MALISLNYLDKIALSKISKHLIGKKKSMCFQESIDNRSLVVYPIRTKDLQ